MSAKKSTTSRERVLESLNHKEPDRIPIDLGGTVMSGIMAETLYRLRQELGLEERPVKVYDVFQMLGEVEMDVVDKLHVDVLPVEPPALFFNIRRENYKPWKLFDGTPVLVPGDFNVETDEHGNWFLHDGGDPNAPIVGRMPKNGYYFDDLRVIYGKYDIDLNRPSLDNVRQDNLLTDEELEWMAKRAELLRNETDKALVGGFWTKSGLGIIGNIPDFLMLIALDKPFVKEYLYVKQAVVMENIKLLWEAVGGNLDIVGLEGFDFGTQNGEMISPSDFEDLYLPHYKEQYEWIHKNTTWKVFQHCCGSITKILPMLVDAGLDIINPVQCSALGMDPKWLKEKFGNKITFWGGGVDTQKTLPFGTPEEVKEEVKERIRIFGPGGGFVFAAVHNIQYGVPAENIVAAFEAAYEYGRYPIEI